MADPKLQIEQRVDELDQKLDRIDQAVRTLSGWLVEAQTGFNEKDAQGIEKILDGEGEDVTGSKEG